jgi:hypothetical protein
MNWEVLTSFNALLLNFRWSHRAATATHRSNRKSFITIHSFIFINVRWCGWCWDFIAAVWWEYYVMNFPSVFFLIFYLAYFVSICVSYSKILVYSAHSTRSALVQHTETQTDMLKSVIHFFSFKIYLWMELYRQLIK